jgi:hypothetical protein
MLATDHLGAPAYARRSPRGSVAVWRPIPGVFVTRVGGHLSEEWATEVSALVRRQVAEEGHHTGFHDWYEMTDYDSRARIVLTDVTLALLAHIDGAHFLIQSRIVAFGVRAANLVIQRLTVHGAPEAFDHAVRQRLAEGGVRAASSAPPARERAQ